MTAKFDGQHAGHARQHRQGGAAGRSRLGGEVHEIVAWVMLLAVLLHVAGAIKHHVMDKDRTLLRMLGR